MKVNSSQVLLLYAKHFQIIHPQNGKLQAVHVQTLAIFLQFENIIPCIKQGLPHKC